MPHGSCPTSVSPPPTATSIFALKETQLQKGGQHSIFVTAWTQVSVGVTPCPLFPAPLAPIHLPALLTNSHPLLLSPAGRPAYQWWTPNSKPQTEAPAGSSWEGCHPLHRAAPNCILLLAACLPAHSCSHAHTSCCLSEHPTIGLLAHPLACLLVLTKPSHRSFTWSVCLSVCVSLSLSVLVAAGGQRGRASLPH